jgi:hypothetical protein
VLSNVGNLAGVMDGVVAHLGRTRHDLVRVVGDELSALGDIANRLRRTVEKVSKAHGSLL